jgi:1,4-dihydroxy-2-naphthoyl-CoA hydrolase
MSAPFTYQRTVRLSDTDAAGVVYFAKVMSICHEAYEESLLASGINLKEFVSNSATAVPIVHAELDCLRPIFCGARLLIHLQPQQLGDNEFTLAYQIVSASDSEKSLAKAITKHVCINPLTRRRMPLSETILNWLRGYSNH